MSDFLESPPADNRRFAGRVEIGRQHPVTLSKDGQMHTRHLEDGRQSEILTCGLACSEIFSGSNLAAVLRPGFEYERSVLDALDSESPAPPLAIHTSAGVPVALSPFLAQLRHVLPWEITPEEEDDWCVSLQMEGGSAVLAAIDLIVQLRHISQRSVSVSDLFDWKIAVGSNSYHGPPSTSPGSRISLVKNKQNQVLYPVPQPFMTAQDAANYLNEFSKWLEDYGSDIACLLVEPQWGSSAVAFPWSPETLRRVIDLCHSYNILVIADEIMCGLGRHGQGTIFLSEAWGLNIDAVTFGKAVAGGAYPLSGAILRRGAKQLGIQGRSALQSHTYSGGNVRALMAATEVLRKIPSFYGNIAECARCLEEEMKKIQVHSDGIFQVQGMGLMWGAIIKQTHPTLISRNLSAADLMKIMKIKCIENGVLPYFVPIGGFMVTPLFDIKTAVIVEIGERLRSAVDCTMKYLLQ